MPSRQWQVWARVSEWIDGDTWRGYVDLGCHIYLGTLDRPIRFRCSLIQAPELSTGKAGLASLAYAWSIAPPGEYAAISTGLDNYGRPLIDLRLEDGSLFSDRMLAASMAVPYR